ncbi:MAG: alpha/beta hydrolase family protein [Bifidobacterium pullorum]|uniref:alpha/beta hydrolase family protein n=1 Tax=Bifidobacterium pullorum TaxID=78448 RepID=UPI003A448418
MELSISRDGLCLHALLERPDHDRPCPIVILCHGFGGSMDAYPDSLYQRIADRLTDRGVAVLRFDFNGHGRSDGDLSHMDVLNEIEDLIAVLRYIRSRGDVTAVRLLGHSQGGVVAGMTAGLYHDVIDRLALLAPAATLKDDALAGTCMGQPYDPDHIPDVVDVPGAGKVGGHYFRIAQLLPIYEVTARFVGPTLAIHGLADDIVDPKASRRYGETMSDCTVSLYPRLDHGIGGADRESAINEVVDFLSA